MVVQNRITYLKKLLEHGAKMVVTSCCNEATLIEKIRFHIYPQVQVPWEKQTFVMYALDWIAVAVDTLSVADRGHRHSDGHSEVTFFISKRGSQEKAVPSCNAIPLDPKFDEFILISDHVRWKITQPQLKRASWPLKSFLAKVLSQMADLI